MKQQERTCKIDDIVDAIDNALENPQIGSIQINSHAIEFALFISHPLFKKILFNYDTTLQKITLKSLDKHVPVTIVNNFFNDGYHDYHERLLAAVGKECLYRTNQAIKIFEPEPINEVIDLILHQKSFAEFSYKLNHDGTSGANLGILMRFENPYTIEVMIVNGKCTIESHLTGVVDSYKHPLVSKMQEKIYNHMITLIENDGFELIIPKEGF